MSSLENIQSDCEQRESMGAGNSSTSVLARQSLSVTTGTIASRLTGFVKAMALVAAIGAVGPVADGFDIANLLPNMVLAVLAGGAISAVLIPQIRTLMSKTDGHVRIEKLLSLSISVLVAVTLILGLFAPLFVRMFTAAGDWNQDAIHFITVLTILAVPQLVLLGYSMIISQVLQVRNQFTAAAWAPVLGNLLSAGAFLLFRYRYSTLASLGGEFSPWPLNQTLTLGAVPTLAVLVQVLMLQVALNQGGFRFRFRVGWRGIGLRPAGMVVFWTFCTFILVQIGTLYARVITSQAGQLATTEGLSVAGNAAYANALKVASLPHGLFVLSIITILYPRLAAAVAINDYAASRHIVSLGLRLSGLINLISTAIMLTLAPIMIRVLLPSMSPHEISVTTPIVRALTLAYLVLGPAIIAMRAFYCLGDGRGVFFVQIAATAANILVLIIGTTLLPFQYWAVLAAIGYGISETVAVIFRFRTIRSTFGGLDGVRVATTYGKAALAALVATALGMGALAVFRALLATSSWLPVAIMGLTTSAVMLGAYVVCLRILNVDELNVAIDLIRAKWRRHRPQPSPGSTTGNGF